MAQVLQLVFDHGTLVVPILPPEGDVLRSVLTEDERTGRFRAPARMYRQIVSSLRNAGVPYQDDAREFVPLEFRRSTELRPYPHQEEALGAWQAEGQRGVVEMPTGSGKTILGLLAMIATKRPTLVVVPTIELLHQWRGVLQSHIDAQVGVVGGGLKDRQAITVITYDSAALQTEFIGNKFGLLVFDEVHHLPSPAYRFIAEGSIAPFRLGLTATLARSDGQESALEHLVGPLVHRVAIGSLEGEFLAPYDIKTIHVTLDPEEAEIYEEARAEYIGFLRREGVHRGRNGWWPEFIMRAHQSEAGRAAYRAYRRQKRIALASKAKLEALWNIFVQHRNDRILVFTEDTEAVYGISEKFFVPGLTHHTHPEERRYLLKAFSEGQLRILVTAKVLNEGVDVPEANVAVILSGNGSVREHVQRLGRILRPREGKRAFLYEVISEVAAEAGISERRRKHAAYERAGSTSC